jgi:RNA polymerase primary sigma factor
MSTAAMVCENSGLSPQAIPEHQAVLSSLTPQQRDLVLEALGSRLDYVSNPIFRRGDAEQELFSQTLIPGDRPTAGSTTLLNAGEEKRLFLCYNYARMQVRHFALRLGKHPDRQTALQIACWQHRALGVREGIVNANIGLVLTMARQAHIAGLDLSELVSEGNMALLRAVEKFDADRGFKFSTYACRAIMMAFNRIAVKTARYRRMVPTQFDLSMEHSDEIQTRRQGTADDAAEELQHIINRNTAHLTDMERRVIEARFAINRSEDVQAMTLNQIGALVGVTKERVRQIQRRALEKLRSTLDREFLRV